MEISEDSFAGLLAEIRRINHCPGGDLPLHAPVFHGAERKYVLDAIDSTYVSSVGGYVNRFEQMLEKTTGAARAVVCVNGTAALEMCLVLAGVRAGDLVLTQAVSFVATANAVAHLGAEPVFLDIDKETLGLNPQAVETFLQSSCKTGPDGCLHKATGKRVAACIPMHTFGLPCRMEALVEVCSVWGIPLVEDAAEAVGSTLRGRHCGTFGLVGALSFNGNKIITSGGGGAILTNDIALGAKAKHWTTTAKTPHKWLYRHDHVGWNFRMPNLNAALGCAQLERLPAFLAEKRARATAYARLFAGTAWEFITEPEGAVSNYWLCAVLTCNRAERDAFLEASNAAGVMTRPVWEPLHTLPMFAHCLRDDLKITSNVADRLVNLPSGCQGQEDAHNVR
ncbi:LegC family aminotransferase [Desulfovibrio legallii]|uniref:Aminotransferase, LLPSF_NHT_00031 family n=1 Tax=Desulfovibrio legallii TaxID=571438 RepID=A0A1G7J8B4_9BACT|nr:LegC family aminotransferase [Desulfovibrio legallii]SDF21128.1 aminotransferase, LLPSF_NHT_00031 family [Desulfovibrio legallii]